MFVSVVIKYLLFENCGEISFIFINSCRVKTSKSPENILTKQTVNKYENASVGKFWLETKEMNGQNQHPEYSTTQACEQSSLSSFLSPRISLISRLTLDVMVRLNGFVLV